MLERMFELSKRGTSVRTEIVAGITTFMTMAYIVFVNPAILSEAGIPYSAAFTATCLAAGLMTLAMGLYANYPFALAAGMGMNSFVIGTMSPKLGGWQAAMAIIFVEGVIITLLVMTRVREWVMDVIPLSLKLGIGVGIGLFIALIGLKQGRIIEPDSITVARLADLRNAVTLMTIAGLCATTALMALRVRSAILIGILFTAAVGVIARVIHFKVEALALPTTFGKLDFSPLIDPRLAVLAWTFVFSSMMVDFFDTMGTVIAVGEEGGFLKDGKLPGLRRVLLVDSLAAAVGGLFGASSNTTYIESAAGVAEGGRTGLASVVTGLLFFLAILLSPVVAMIGGGVVVGKGAYSPVTAPALIVVGFLMMSVVRRIKWENVFEAFPAFLIIVGIPLTYSISYGIGLGFIAYAVIRLLSGRWRELNPLMLVLSILFGAAMVVR